MNPRTHSSAQPELLAPLIPLHRCRTSLPLLHHLLFLSIIDWICVSARASVRLKIFGDVICSGATACRTQPFLFIYLFFPPPRMLFEGSREGPSCCHGASARPERAHWPECSTFRCQLASNRQLLPAGVRATGHVKQAGNRLVHSFPKTAYLGGVLYDRNYDSEEKSEPAGVALMKRWQRCIRDDFCPRLIKTHNYTAAFISQGQVNDGRNDPLHLTPILDSVVPTVGCRLQ